MRVTNVRIRDLLKVLNEMETEYCDIEINERENTVKLCEIIPVLLIEDKERKPPTPEDLEGFM